MDCIIELIVLWTSSDYKHYMEKKNVDSIENTIILFHRGCGRVVPTRMCV